MTQTRFPAVDRLQAQLRADLMRAARANPHARSRRRRRLLVVAVSVLLATPASLAAAGVFDSPDVAVRMSRGAAAQRPRCRGRRAGRGPRPAGTGRARAGAAGT